ncbi:hypothetical protein JIX56_40435 [Streptomyces sp. CA-210063]|uniref:hypothetical protein n=1 Tax=Streptomyces sp. CA-210063 TaxID=2801029 RepID=UPI00214C5B80|nr:hypothetical protein [Streptomyces sp. CA-210063]UUU35622.1 hypothetical protein JIX56_40435 [Streptomyces sp. CA-210063]
MTQQSRREPRDESARFDKTLAADALHDVRALGATRHVTLTGPNGDGPPGSARAPGSGNRRSP